MVDEMLDFWRARLDEDEQEARYCGPARVAWLTYRSADGQLLYTTVAAEQHGDDPGWVADGRELPTPSSYRIVFDPARVLRDVQADREILRLYEQQIAKSDENAMQEDRAWTLWPVVADRVAVHCEHPDYRPEWAA